MNIKIICVGNVKEKYFVDAIAEYSKRLSRFVKLKIVEVKEDQTIKNPSPKQIEQIKQKETYKIIEQLEGAVVLLSTSGKNISSPELSSSLKSLEQNFSTISFVIGGSFGYLENQIENVKLKLKFGDVTFPHQLFRVMLLEQIYRAYTIINNIVYHK